MSSRNSKEKPCNELFNDIKNTNWNQQKYHETITLYNSKCDKVANCNSLYDAGRDVVDKVKYVKVKLDYDNLGCNDITKKELIEPVFREKTTVMIQKPVVVIETKLSTSSKNSSSRNSSNNNETNINPFSNDTSKDVSKDVMSINNIDKYVNETGIDFWDTETKKIKDPDHPKIADPQQDKQPIAEGGTHFDKLKNTISNITTIDFISFILIAITISIAFNIVIKNYSKNYNYDKKSLMKVYGALIIFLLIVGILIMNYTETYDSIKNLGIACLLASIYEIYNLYKVYSS